MDFATMSYAVIPRTSRPSPPRNGMHGMQGMQGKQAKPGNSSIHEQLMFAQRKYQEVLAQQNNTPKHLHSKKSEEDVWAWGMFSETVLPMLLFVDDC